MKKIVIISRGDIGSSPTIINYLKAFTFLGFEAHCICSSDLSGIQKKVNANFYLIGCANEPNPLKKIFNYYRFGKKTSRIINDNFEDNNVLIWISRIDTALCFGRKFKNMKSILALHELHDSFAIWKLITKFIIHSYNNVVYNEINRANIGRVWYELNFTPSIIPNKPYDHPFKRNIQLKDVVLDNLFKELKNSKKIILYQGSLLRDRNIEPLVKASLRFKENFILIIMGKDSDNRIGDLKNLNPDLIHIPWVSPPDHLFITSHAHIGVAFYDFDCLNSIYCAPNKIWEYSGFGIPVIGQNIPGLLNTVGNSHSGICVDIENEIEIIEAIECIEGNYEFYSSNSLKFYHSIDFNLAVNLAIQKAIN